MAPERRWRQVRAEDRTARKMVDLSGTISCLGHFARPADLAGVYAILEPLGRQGRESGGTSTWQESLDELGCLGLQVVVEFHFEELAELIHQGLDLPVLPT